MTDFNENEQKAEQTPQVPEQSGQQGGEQQNGGGQNAGQQGGKQGGFFDTPDHTAEFDKTDIDNNKVMGILAYIGILVLIPLLAAKDSKFARFHANQGLILLIAGIVVSICVSLLGMIPYLGWVFRILGGLVGLCTFVLMILGIINAANGQAKELPLIGKFKLLK